MATVIERAHSREETVSPESPRGTIALLVINSSTDEEAKAAVEAYLPLAVGVTILNNYQFKPLGCGVYEVTGEYGPKKTIEQEGWQHTFEIGTTNVHITQSKSTVARYAPDGEVAPDFKGAIGVNGDQIEGCDVEVATYTFSETHIIPAALVTSLYERTLFSLVSKVNNASFRGFDAGQIKFKGASGTKRTDAKYEITYRFEGSSNAEDLVIGDIDGIDKLGWDYLWVLYKDVADGDAKRLVKRPAAVYVERVCDFADFTDIGIGTGERVP